MKYLLVIFLFFDVVYAGNAGLYIINKVKEDIFFFGTDGGVLSVTNSYGKRTYGKNLTIFPGEKIFATIRCEDGDFDFAGKGKSTKRFYSVHLNAKCGQYYTWNITSEDMER